MLESLNAEGQCILGTGPSGSAIYLRLTKRSAFMRIEIPDRTTRE
jgi:hypothetical protein